MRLARITKAIAAVGAAAVLAVVLGAAVLWQQRSGTVELPMPAGPYAVGRVRYDWTDAERIDPLAPEPNVRRELPVWIWYPADPAASAARAPNATVPQRAAMRRTRGAIFRSFDALLRTDATRVLSHALDAPALAAAPARLPVALLKPGRGASAADYSVLAEDLASRGYVVVGSDSPNTTGLVAYLDGRVVPRSPAGAPPEYDRGPANDLAPGHPKDFALRVLDVWAGDLRFLLDRLAALAPSDAAGMFAGRLDLAAVGAFGHSFGGAAALQFCSIDERCKASIDLDGLPLGAVVTTGLTKPFLFVVSDRPVMRLSREQMDEAGRTFFAALDRMRATLPNPNDLLVLEGTAHWNFGDAAMYTALGLARLFQQLGPIEPERGLALSTRYVGAFFDAHLRGIPDDVLDGPHKDYPEGLWQPR